MNDIISLENGTYSYARPQGHRKVDEAIIFLLTANSGGERLTMKSRLFVSVPSDFGNRDKGSLTLR